MPPRRTIEGHPDFSVLEARLAALVREAKIADGPLGPIAIIAPTRRLLAHLQVTLAGLFPSLLNVRFFHHESLLEAAAAAAGLPPLRLIGETTQEAILAAVVARVGGDLAPYLKERPGAIAAILATVQDLREAGVAEAAPSSGLSQPARQALRLVDEHSRALDALAKAGLRDRAGLYRSALPTVAAYARRFRRLIHYGAYELIGLNLDLMRAVETSGASVTYLVPFHPEAPAFLHARRFWPEMLGVYPTMIPAAADGDRLFSARLTCLYDESGLPPAALPAELATYFHAQGAEAELREVARRILGLHAARETPLREVAVIARSLEPYAALLRPVFAEHRLPFTTSASQGALRQAKVRAALCLARAVVGDFERQPLLDLLRSGLFIGRRGDPSPEADAWDRLSRDWAVTRGTATWTHHLPEWLALWSPYLPDAADAATRERTVALKAARLGQARALAAEVEALALAAAPLGRARSWTAWAGALLDLFGRHLRGFGADDAGPDPAVAAVLDAIRDLEDLDAVGLPFGSAVALGRFERALGRATIPIGSVGADGTTRMGDEGGVRILDAMQARGLAFDAVFLIGWNADLVPQHPREDPFLGEADRRELRRTLGRPIPIPSDLRDEEHLLLAHLLGAARRSLTVSWQRADESGRAKVRSLALRELGRVTLQAPDLRRVEAAAYRVPSHPADAGREALAQHQLMPPAEAALNVALELRSPRLLREALGDLPAAPGLVDPDILTAGLDLLEAIGRFSPADLSYDAFVGDHLPPVEVWSPSRLEILGACPQHYFFRHALHVDEMAEPAEAHELDPMDLGGRVHAVLHDLYRRLFLDATAAPGGGDAAAIEARARDLLEPIWDEKTRPLAARLRAVYPILWESTSKVWIEALRDFLVRDLSGLVRDRTTVLGLEEEVDATLALAPEGRVLRIAGRFDRVCRAPGTELIVADYKTAGTLDNHVKMIDLLKGRRLQMPLYLLMAESRRAAWSADREPVRVEVLGVGPGFLPADPGGIESPETQARLDPESFEKNRAGLLETIAVVADLAAAGSFPLNETSRLCPFCPYLRACRRSQAPTLARLESAPGALSYALLRRKSTRASTLAEVRSRGDRKEEA